MQINSIFNPDRLICSCACGGGVGGRTTGLAQETPFLVRYIGPGTASRAYTANGRRYVFGDNKSNRIMPVFETDLDSLFTTYPNLFERMS